MSALRGRGMSVLELDHVSYSYPGATRPALVDVTLALSPGELVVLAGASGSGKSTLLRAASGLVPYFYGGELAGRVTTVGLDTREHGPGELAAVVGTLFQDPETQVVMGTPRAELAFPLENRGEPPAAIARGVEEAALALGIAHLLDRPVNELSGGELQRVSLGAALAGRPSLVLLDEPTSQLDPVAGDELIGLLRRLNEDSDTTVVLAEHRLERCLASADRVIAVAEGRVVCDAAPEQFLAWASDAAPELQTPGARLLDEVGVAPVPGVKRARSSLRARGLLPAAEAQASATGGRPRPRPRLRSRTSRGPAPALAFDRVWHELRDGPAILRGVSLTIETRERVALMGRNGAGKSTLLRHAGGIMRATRGAVRAQGRVALLLQNPTDYLIRDTVAQEAPAEALAVVGLADATLADRHPRDLAGGEKQRLALAIVLDGGGERARDGGRETASDGNEETASVLCLDEPTRGMDRRHKAELAALLRGLECAVLVASHDPEFIAAFAERVVLLAEGAVLADGPVADVLAGGTYFATETARILGGAGLALRPEQGAEVIASERAMEVTV